jgi:aspartyl-tRNA(Asn)/glutamyl-tRNA(Gln) amidotransferase subunit A
MRDAVGHGEYRDKPLTDFTAQQLAAAYRAGQLSPVEVTRAILERIESVDPSINAFITVSHDQALAAASAADRLFQAGIDLGPLQGVPVSLKDIFDVRGARTTCASAQRFDAEPAPRDAVAVARLRRAGAVVIGKTNLHEFAAGVPDPNGPFGWVQNPRRIGYQAGSSSSGSAAAVAAGLGPLSFGTDTAQSVRIPAALCGVVGLKPTYGRVPVTGVIPLSASLDHVGPLARSVADVAVALQVIAGHDPTDPLSSTRPVEAYADELGALDENIRIGIPANPFFREAEPAVLDAYGAAVEALERLGARLVDCTLDSVEETPSATQILLQVEAALYHERYRGREHLYGESFRQILLPGRTHSGMQYVRARQLQAELSRCWQRLFQGCDVLVTPTSPVVAPLHGVSQVQINGSARDFRLEVSRFTRPFSLTGLPAIALPSGRTPDGLPTSVQLIAAPFDEVRLLRVAAALEQALDVQRTLSTEVG